MQLRELAHSRTGDKGNTLNVSVICRDARDYAHLREHLSAERVKDWLGAWLGAFVLGEVVRHELPMLAAFNFVLGEALGGGVTRSLALDAHGKSVGSVLLAIEVPAPPRG
jgi:hypothetical protein